MLKYKLGILILSSVGFVTHICGQTKSTVTFENEDLVDESSQFLNYGKIKRVNSILFNHTQKSRSTYSHRLSGTINERIGLAKSIGVMPGDTVKIEVFLKYIDYEKINIGKTITNLVLALLSGSGFKIGADKLQTINQSLPTSIYPLPGVSQESSDALPMAYLNWLVFDEQYNLVDGGYKRISNTANENGKNLPHEKLRSEITISNKGYVYTYLSNESVRPVDVFFDDFTVTLLSASSILSEDGTIITTEAGQNFLTEQN